MMRKQKGNMYSFVDYTWNVIQGRCPHNCEYCMPKETNVLMSDFTYKKINNIIVGDHVWGVKKSEHGHYRFQITDVLATSDRISNTIKVTTSDGEIECTPEHSIMGSTSSRHCTDWKCAKSFSPYESIRYIGEPSSETDELLIGWLSGFCDGDGCFFKHNNGYKDYLGFEAVCIDDILREYFINTCNKFGIEMLVGYKVNSPNSFSPNNKSRMVFSRKSENVKKLRDLTLFSFDKTIDYYKGYVAGMIDTDGTVRNDYIRIAQSHTANPEKCERIKFCLEKLNMHYVVEEHGFRVLGGFKNRATILFTFKPRHSYKSLNLINNLTIKGSWYSEIQSIAKGSETVEVYNLQTATENYIANGFIVHNCFMKSFPQGELHFNENEMKTNLGKDNFIFVGSSCDMFAEVIPEEWILKVLEYCSKFDNKYLFQSKNPRRMLDLEKYLPRKVVLGTTIESNRTYECMGDTPSPFERARIMKSLKNKGYETMLTLEPILDFDLPDFFELIKIANPTWVNIGADSKGHNLPEPSKEKILALIEKLSTFTSVKQKDNLKRLLK